MSLSIPTCHQTRFGSLNIDISGGSVHNTRARQRRDTDPDIVSLILDDNPGIIFYNRVMLGESPYLRSLETRLAQPWERWEKNIPTDYKRTKHYRTNPVVLENFFHWATEPVKANARKIFDFQNKQASNIWSDLLKNLFDRNGINFYGAADGSDWDYMQDGFLSNQPHIRTIVKQGFSPTDNPFNKALNVH